MSDLKLIIDGLWKLHDKFEDADHVVCGDAATVLQKIVDSCAQSDNPPVSHMQVGKFGYTFFSVPDENPSLTLEQLRQMEGKPVWISTMGEWRTVYIGVEKDVRLYSIFNTISAKHVLDNGGRIYAHKPEPPQSASKLVKDGVADG